MPLKRTSEFPRFLRGHAAGDGFVLQLGLCWRTSVPRSKWKKWPVRVDFNGHGFKLSKRLLVFPSSRDEMVKFYLQKWLTFWNGLWHGSCHLNWSVDNFSCKSCWDHGDVLTLRDLLRTHLTRLRSFWWFPVCTPRSPVVYHELISQLIAQSGGHIFTIELVCMEVNHIFSRSFHVFFRMFWDITITLWHHDLECLQATQVGLRKACLGGSECRQDSPFWDDSGRFFNDEPVDFALELRSFSGQFQGWKGEGMS